MEGDKFNWNGRLVAEHRGKKFINMRGSSDEVSFQYTNTYLSYIPPENLFLLEDGISITRNGVTTAHQGAILPPKGSVLYFTHPSGLSVIYSKLTLSELSIENTEVLRNGWLVTVGLTFSGSSTQTFDLNNLGVSSISFSGTTEERLISTFTETKFTRSPVNKDENCGQRVLISSKTPDLFTNSDYQSTVAFDEPAVNSAGSPMEMTGAWRQVVISMEFNRSAIVTNTGMAVFDPVGINVQFIGTVNNNLYRVAGYDFNPHKLRLDKYDCTVVPIYDPDYSQAVGVNKPYWYFYKVNAQVTYDPLTFYRHILDAGLMLRGKVCTTVIGTGTIADKDTLTDENPKHIWAVEVEDKNNPDEPNEVTGIHTFFGTKAQCLKKESGTHKAEKVTTAVCLNGRGWPADIKPSTGMQDPFYRAIMIEEPVDWPTTSGWPVGPEGLLPNRLIEFRPPVEG